MTSSDNKLYLFPVERQLTNWRVRTFPKEGERFIRDSGPNGDLLNAAYRCDAILTGIALLVSISLIFTSHTSGSFSVPFWVILCLAFLMSILSIVRLTMLIRASTEATRRKRTGA